MSKYVILWLLTLSGLFFYTSKIFSDHRLKNLSAVSLFVSGMAWFCFWLNKRYPLVRLIVAAAAFAGFFMIKNKTGKRNTDSQKEKQADIDK